MNTEQRRIRIPQFHSSRNSQGIFTYSCFNLDKWSPESNSSREIWILEEMSVFEAPINLLSIVPYEVRTKRGPAYVFLRNALVLKIFRR